MTVPQGKTFRTTLGGRELILETGKYAKQASGSVTVRYGDTLVLVTAQMSNDATPLDFLPLTVEYEERHYAVGKIPGSFLRREGRPGNQATLNARITDRQIRPLFPKGLRNEVQVLITILSADQENDPAPLAAIGASAALALSDIPWDGPLGCATVGYSEGQYVLNPTFQQLPDSPLQLTVASTSDAVLMVEASADELPEHVMIGAIEFAQQELQPVIALIQQMREEAGQPKRDFVPALDASEEVAAQVRELAREGGLRDLIQVREKQERNTKVKELRSSIIDRLAGSNDEQDQDLVQEVKNAFRKAEAAESRDLVLNENRRSDGRSPADVRPIWIETGVLPRAHGSAVFTRGETQVLGVATLGTGRDNRLVDDLGLEDSEEFMLHYNFPPYSTGEVKRMRGVSRRELGHGNLARRSLERQIPSQEDFPYVLRVVAETFESNGSSSMAAVCAASLSLMDAGVPLKNPVAGIAMGLVLEGDRYAVLSDILGSEDALGDMDFKVTGTRNGVTALQMDIKISGLDASIMQEALDQAREGRLHILDRMASVLDAPRDEISRHAPRILTVTIPSDKIGSIIGPGGKNIRELEALGATIEIEETGIVKIYSDDSDAANEVKRRIEEMTATAEVGKIYEGRVAKIVDFGAFITLFTGTDGLLHISQIAEERVENVTDFLQEGAAITVKVNGIDDRGKIDLIRPELEGKIAPRRPAAPRPRGPRNDRGPRGGRDDR